MTDNESCLCGSGRAYGICCKPFSTMTAEDYRKERANNNHIKAYYIAVAMLSDYLQKVKTHANIISFCFINCTMMRGFTQIGSKTWQRM